MQSPIAPSKASVLAAAVAFPRVTLPQERFPRSKLAATAARELVSACPLAHLAATPAMDVVVVMTADAVEVILGAVDLLAAAAVAPPIRPHARVL